MSPQLSSRAGTVALFLLLSGCGSGVALAPAPTAQRQQHPELGEVALTRSEGVTLAASAQSWPGSSRVERKLTPIRVEIINESAVNLHDAIADIHLITDSKQLPARAPESIEVDPLPTTVGKTAADFDSRTGTYEFRSQDPAKLTINRQIQVLSLPEGSIPSGERVEGFVYFDPLPRNIDQATLRVSLRESPSGPVYATLDIPFARER